MSPLDFIPIHARQGGSGGPTAVGLFVTVGPCCSLASDHIIKPCPGFMTPMPSQNRRPCCPPTPPHLCPGTYPNIWQPLASPFQENSIKTRHGGLERKKVLGHMGRSQGLQDERG